MWGTFALTWRNYINLGLILQNFLPSRLHNKIFSNGPYRPLFPLFFVLLSQFYRIKLLTSKGVELGLLEKKVSTMTTWTPPPRPMSGKICLEIWGTDWVLLNKFAVFIKISIIANFSVAHVMWCNITKFRVVVAQLVLWSLLTPEIRGLDLVVDNFY